MEDKKNYPPLPSNYLTLAQLQERWLKEKEIEQKQKLPQQDDDPVLHHPHLPQDQQRQPKTQQQAWRVIPRHGTGFGSATGNLQPKKIRPKNRNFSKSDRVAIELRCEKQENLEAKADIGDENAGHDGKRKESKKKQKRPPRKPRVDREDRRVAEDAAESTMDRDKEVVHSDFHRVDEKTESKSELDVKSKNLVMELKKQKRVNRKPRADKEDSRVSQDAAEWTMEGNKEVENSDVQRVDDKTESKSELNVKSKNLVMELKKQKRVNRKPRADREQSRVSQDAAEWTMEGNNEVENSDLQRVNDKTESKSELNVKSKNLVMELKKQKRVNWKPRADREESRVSQDAAEVTMEGNKEVENSDVQRVDDKTEIESELNGKRNNLMKEVEGKLGTLSMKYGSEKQNVRLRRPYNSFHGSQRNYVGRPCNNGPYGDNGRFRSQQVQRPRGDNKIWVRKNENVDGNVGGIEIASDTSKGRGEHT